MRKNLFLILVLLFGITLIYASDNKIKSVAPFAFNDSGDVLEIKGGWNFSSTKYESTVIYCDKKTGVCADYTARLVKGHLNIAPMLWQIVSWDDVVIAKSAIVDMYSDHFLYINRKNKKVFIFEKFKSENPYDISNLDALVLVEQLQDTFYQEK